MMNFTCKGCGKIFPDIMENSHHIIPTELGGQDIDSNKALLCPGCHQLIHYLVFARKGGKNIEAVVGEYLISIKCEDIRKYASVLLEYVNIIYNKYILYKQGVITIPKEYKKLKIELLYDVKELLRLDAKNSNRGLEQHVKIILLRYLQNKYPDTKSIIEEELIKLLH